MSVPYNANYDLTMPFVDDSARIALGVGVEQVYTVPGVPTDKFSARFSYTSTSNVFVRRNSAPTTPGAASVSSQSESEYRPGADGSQRYVSGGDTLHFLTPDATAYVGVRLMKVPS
jgi:hypothetical protein